MRSKTFIRVIIALLAIIMVSSDAMAQTKKSSMTSTVKRTTISASPTFYLTEEGIDGVIKLGDSYKNIPQKVAGLYDIITTEKNGENIITGEWSGEYYLSFSLKKDPDATCFYATTDKDGNINSICIVEYKVIKAKVNGQIIAFGSKYSALSKLTGAKAGVDENGNFPVTFIGNIEFIEGDDWEGGSTDKISQMILRK